MIQRTDARPGIARLLLRALCDRRGAEGDPTVVLWREPTRTNGVMVRAPPMLGGDELSKHYAGLRQATLDALMAKFTEIDENIGLPTKQPKKAP